MLAAKTKPASLLNAVFKATEVGEGASFAKKEGVFYPSLWNIFKKKEEERGADVKSGTGEYEALSSRHNFSKGEATDFEAKKMQAIFHRWNSRRGWKVISDPWR